MRVLLIDDAAVICAIFTRIACSLGAAVTAVATMDEGVRAAQAEPFAAMVVDGRLPGGTIGDHVGRLCALAPQSAVLVIAALDERALVREASAAGAGGAILRPLRRAQIRDILAGIEAPRS